MPPSARYSNSYANVWEPIAELGSCSRSIYEEAIMATTDNHSGTVILTVPGMTCSHCEAAVTAELESIAGVTAVAVDLESKRVSVAYVGALPEQSLLEAAIDQAGFELAGVEPAGVESADRPSRAD